MARKESTRKQTQEVIGYPEKPMPRKYIIITAAAWAAWIGFLLAMAFIRRAEWPFWPT